MFLLDLTGLIPLLLFISTYSSYRYFLNYTNIGLWTKTLIIGSVMALIKGTTDLVTVIPDSGGWARCKERLGEEDLESMTNVNANSSSSYDFGAIFELFFLEILGSGSGGARRMRYCGDMLISGHTYFAVLFSLSSWEMTRRCAVVAGTPEPPDSSLQKNLKRFSNFVLVVALLCVLTEISLVAMARFHYSVDMYLSILLVLALWDSSPIECMASSWTEGYLWKGSCPQWKRPSLFWSCVGGLSLERGVHLHRAGGGCGGKCCRRAVRGSGTASSSSSTPGPGGRTIPAVGNEEAGMSSDHVAPFRSRNLFSREIQVESKGFGSIV